MNKERFAVILDTIKANPACWNQGMWHSRCGTAHCIAGHAQINAGKATNRITAKEDGIKWLDLTYKEAKHLFSSERTIADFERVLSEGFDKPETWL